MKESADLIGWGPVIIGALIVLAVIVLIFVIVARYYIHRGMR